MFYLVIDSRGQMKITARGTSGIYMSRDQAGLYYDTFWNIRHFCIPHL